MLKRLPINRLLGDGCIDLADTSCPPLVTQDMHRHLVGAARRSSTPFRHMKARMGATHLLMKTLPRVASERALHVLAYNMTKVMSIIGVRPAYGGDEGIASQKCRQPQRSPRLRAPRRFYTAKTHSVIRGETHFFDLDHFRISRLARS